MTALSGTKESGILISKMTKSQSSVQQSLYRWLKSHPDADGDLKASAMRATLLHFSQELAPDISRAAEATIADVIPKSHGVILHETFVTKKHLDTRIGLLSGITSPEELSVAASTILVDMVQNTLEMTQRYYTHGSGEKDFYSRNAGDTVSRKPKGAGRRKVWKRVLDPGACEWCRSQKSAFVRHRGCKCGRVLKLERE